MKLSVDLGVLMFWEISKEYILSIYFGERAFWSTAKHWSAPFETGSQFVFSNSFFPRGLQSFSPKQYLMQEFGVDCNLIFSDIDKFGYYTQHAKNVVELSCCITFFWEDMINIYFIHKVTYLHLMNYQSIQPLSAVL